MQNKSVSKSIGANIRMLRLEKGLSQDELATELYVTRQTVSNYETGRSQPDLDMLQQLATALDVELLWLLYGKPEDSRREKKRATQIIISVSCLLLALTAILCGYTDFLQQQLYSAIPHILVRLILLPVSMAFLGAAILQMLDYKFGIGKIKNRKNQIVGKSVVGVLLAVNILVVLPYVFLGCYILFKILSGSNSISVFFPPIPIYQEVAYLFMTLMYSYPFLYVIVGISLRLFFTDQ